MEMIFHSHANKTHFHKKGWTLGLILKVRVLELGSGPLALWKREGNWAELTFAKISGTVSRDLMANR